MDEKELDKISKEIARIFKKNKWTWAIRKGLHIPNSKEIKENILSTIKDIGKNDSWISCGRLRIERDYNGYDILIEGEEFHIDD